MHLGISILILLLCLKTKSRRWTKLALLILSIFSLGIVSETLWKIVEYPWQRIDESKASNVDAIVVLSSGRSLDLDEIKIIKLINPEGFLAGIRLYEKGKARKLIFTGGSDPLSPAKSSEGDLYKKAAINLGIPSESISLTGRVFNTSEEAKAIKRILSASQKYNPKKSTSCH